MSAKNPEMTPMKRQYYQIKEQNQDSILFFRLGDFYEMFDEDARLAAKELDLTLTTRDRGKPKEEQTPMCGVPYHSVDAYIARLVAKGYKVAICEQMEDPSQAKGIVERDISRIITPGTVTESCMLDESRNNYMGCLYGSEERYGLAFCDVSTGAFFVTVCANAAAAASELGRFSPAEVLRSGPAAADPIISDTLIRRLSCCVNEGGEAPLDLGENSDVLEQHFGKDLSALGLAGMSEAIIAAGTLLSTLKFVQKNPLEHIRDLQYYTTGQFMELDMDARRNLELCETMRSKEKKGTLLWVLDKTRTAMGSRMLRGWLQKPLLDETAILHRQDAVEELLNAVLSRGELSEALRDISDLERITSRVVTGSVNPREILGLARGLRALPQIHATLSSMQAPLLQQLCQQVDILQDCADRIEQTLVDEPPLTIREGGLIRDGANAEVDRLK